MPEQSQNIPLMYKGRPLRRKDNLIYYGSMDQKYIIMLQVLETKKVKDLDVATKVSLQLQLTDPDLKSRDRVIKKGEKDSLYAAMDVAAVWLDRALSGK
jgi:arginyl-tRNA synthetase